MEIQNNTKNWVNELESIMATLRSEKGCPWDKEQTHDSLKKYLIEEVYELIEAIEEKNTHNLMDELGDVLLQVIFHSQIAKESNQFNLQKVAENCCEKLIRRHPHVFGQKEIKTSAGVLKEWNKIKKKESLLQDRKSILDGIPKSLPGLRYAQKVQGKAAHAGFEWDRINGIWEKLEEEIEELKEGINKKNSMLIKEELGDVFFTLVNLSRFLKESAEDALRFANAKFVKRIQFMENQLVRDGFEMENLSISQLEEYWKQAKACDDYFDD